MSGGQPSNRACAKSALRIDQRLKLIHNLSFKGLKYRSYKKGEEKTTIYKEIT